VEVIPVRPRRGRKLIAADSFKTGAREWLVMADLTNIPNVGPKIAARLRRLGIESPQDLQGRDPEELFERLCALDGRREDPCLLDTFTAAVDFANGAPARPWWEYSRERLAHKP
jgi:hypothetical protein